MPETVVLTRFPADDVPLADRLARAGVRTIQLSCLRIEPLVAPATMGDALGMLGPEDRLVFTSRAGVDAARLALPATEVRVPVAAVGPATARACANWGLAAWTPSAATGAALGRELPLGSGEAVLVRGERADRAIVAELARRGATIGELVAYRTVADVQGDVGAARRALLEGARVVLASPAAADALASAVGDAVLSAARVIAIGPTTAAHVARRVATPPRIAASPTIDALLDALEVPDVLVHG